MVLILHFYKMKFWGCQAVVTAVGCNRAPLVLWLKICVVQLLMVDGSGTLVEC